MISNSLTVTTVAATNYGATTYANTASLMRTAESTDQSVYTVTNTDTVIGAANGRVVINRSASAATETSYGRRSMRIKVVLPVNENLKTYDTSTGTFNQLAVDGVVTIGLSVPANIATSQAPATLLAFARDLLAVVGSSIINGEV